MVLFSAAPPGQGGEHHLNEQPYDYWRALFRAPWLRGRRLPAPSVDAGCRNSRWYRHNLMLYVRRDELQTITAFARQFQLRDEEPVPDTSPFAYRLRKRIVRTLPQPICDRLARWNARRFPAD